MFPGQSSYSAGVLSRAATLGAASRRVLDDACERLGRDLAKGDSAPGPRTNREVQVALFVATMMHLAALRAAGIDAEISLGLSLGEYAHLTHAGALTLADAVSLVDARGRLYDEGPPGKMAAVFPLSLGQLRGVLEDIEGVVEIVNLNTPTQHVIAGEPQAVDRALAALDEAFAVASVIIEDRIPMHSSLFEPVARRLEPYLASVRWGTAHVAYRPNVDASVIEAPTAQHFVGRLTAHVWRPVLWRASIEACIVACPDVVFVEVGPGTTLTNLLQKRWVKSPRVASEAGVAAVAQRLSDA